MSEEQVITTTALNRWSEKVIYNDGKTTARCYTHMNPHYFKDEKGNLNPIEIDRAEIITSGVGDVTLKSKNIVSVGIRQDNDTEKYLGLRPDETQALGTEQLEFSIESTSFNGKDIFVDLSKNDFIDPLTMDLGGVVVRNNRQFSRQMTKVDRELSDFTIKYKLYLKGLRFQNNIANKVNETLRPNTSIKSTELGAVQSSDFVKEISRDTEDFEIISAHIINDHLWLTDSPLVEGYADIFPDGYTTYKWSLPVCAPITLKSSVTMVIKNNPIGKKDLFNLIKEILLQIIDGTFADGFTIQKNGKLAAHFNWDTKNDIFWIQLVCEEPDYQSFSAGEIYENLAPIGLTPSAATAEFLSIFNKAINKDEIILNGEYIEPDKNNMFIIVNDKEDFKFYITEPKLLDSDFDIVSSETLHTLKKIGDGVYEYTKYPDLNCFVGAENIAYIDAEIVYSRVTDGYLAGPLAITWDNARNEAGGLKIDDADTINIFSRVFELGKIGWRYRVMRGFSFYDTSAITDDIESVSLKVYHDAGTEQYTRSTLVAMEGTQNEPLLAAMFQDFTGSSYGSVLTVDDAWTEIVFNSDGINNIVKGGTTLICTREKEHDYDNVEPPAEVTMRYVCTYLSTDYAGTDYDPYLEITLAAGIKPVMMVF
jgi:hypothetical protein